VRNKRKSWNFAMFWERTAWIRRCAGKCAHVSPLLNVG
jgi:hypothetical protein